MDAKHEVRRKDQMAGEALAVTTVTALGKRLTIED